MIALGGAPIAAQSLRGSSASLDAQNRAARAHDFTYLGTPAQVTRFASAGYLVRVRPNTDYALHAVSFPYARPELALFVRRLAAQYRAACGEQLVVTSLTRPRNRQPANASARSVHPTGMAVDFRRSNRARCRSWLEGVLLDLEGAGVLEATRERLPSHYHVALFPRPYAAYVELRTSAVTRASAAPDRDPTELVPYEVRRGDSLWAIARRLDTTVEVLKATNGLNESRIYAGQVLHVPAAR